MTATATARRLPETAKSLETRASRATAQAKAPAMLVPVRVMCVERATPAAVRVMWAAATARPSAVAMETLPPALPEVTVMGRQPATATVMGRPRTGRRGRRGARRVRPSS